jgi:cysteine synthase
VLPLLAGTGRYLKSKNPNVKVVAVEPRAGLYHRSNPVDPGALESAPGLVTQPLSW